MLELEDGHKFGVPKLVKIETKRVVTDADGSVLIALDIRVEPLSAPTTDAAKPGRHGHPALSGVAVANLIAQGASLTRRLKPKTAKLPREIHRTPGQVSRRFGVTRDGVLAGRKQDKAKPEDLRRTTGLSAPKGLAEQSRRRRDDRLILSGASP